MNYFLLIISVAALFCLSCQSERSMVKTTGSSDFSGFESFAFLPEPGDDMVYDDEIIRLRSLRIIQNELTQRGFQVDKTNPDMLVIIRPMFGDFHDDDDFPGKERSFPEPRVNPGVDLFFNGEIRKPYTLAENLRNIEYAPGTIVVDIFERSSGQLLWSGWFDQAISPTGTPEELEFYFNRLFEKFPVDVQ